MVKGFLAWVNRFSVHRTPQFSVKMKLLTSTLAILTLFLSSVYCQENNDNDIQKAERRTLDLSFLGIDLSQIFDRLLSPTGIVNQFAISISLQLFQSVGYVLTGRNNKSS